MEGYCQSRQESQQLRHRAEILNESGEEGLVRVRRITKHDERTKPPTYLNGVVSLEVRRVVVGC
jgi:hypothetical protein